MMRWVVREDECLLKLCHALKSITVTAAIYFVGGFERVNEFHTAYSPQDEIPPSYVKYRISSPKFCL
jgi:hypothetical protein